MLANEVWPAHFDNLERWIEGNDAELEATKGVTPREPAGAALTALELTPVLRGSHPARGAFAFDTNAHRQW